MNEKNWIYLGIIYVQCIQCGELQPNMTYKYFHLIQLNFDENGKIIAIGICPSCNCTLKRTYTLTHDEKGNVVKGEWTDEYIKPKI